MQGEGLRQGTEAGLKGLQGHNKLCGPSAVIKESAYFRTAAFCAARTTLWPHSRVARSHRALQCREDTGDGASRWATRASIRLATSLKRTNDAKSSPQLGLAYGVMPWWRSCWWPQRGNNKVKDYANNCIQRAPIPKGHQQTAAIANGAALRMLVRVHHTRYAVRFAGGKRSKTTILLTELFESSVKELSTGNISFLNDFTFRRVFRGALRGPFGRGLAVQGCLGAFIDVIVTLKPFFLYPEAYSSRPREGLGCLRGGVPPPCSSSGCSCCCCYCCCPT